MIGAEAEAQVMTLPLDPDAARLARGWLAPRLAGFPSEVADDAMLLTSELVCNVSRYGLPPVRVSLRITPPGLEIGVLDREGALPVFSSVPPEPTQPNGRGLLLLQRMATAWGVDPLVPGPGKTVWFTLGMG